MEVTSLCIRLLIGVLFLMCVYDQRVDSVFLRISPNRLQFLEYEPLTFHCECFSGSTGWKIVRNFKGKVSSRKTTGNVTSTGFSCIINNVYSDDSGEYFCEDDGGERSNSINITVTSGSMILESPALPVMEGKDATLRCRNKMTSSNLTADFYKDGRLKMSSSTGNMTIHSVSKSDEGLYKCIIPDDGESAESWLAVRVSATCCSAGSVILESPVLPVMKGEAATLRCRNKMGFTSFTADFYKNGHLKMSSSTGEMTINRVSKSDEGLYKCRISDVGESAESWLAVRDEEKTTSSIHTSPSSTPWIIVTVFLVALLLVVGLFHLGKGYWHRVLLSLSTLMPGPGSPVDQTVSTDASAAAADKATYAAVTKNRKKKDGGELLSGAVYYMLGLDDTQQLEPGASSVTANSVPSAVTNPALREDAFYSTIQ